jgi:hypothetical protein
MRTLRALALVVDMLAWAPQAVLLYGFSVTA